MGRYKKVLLTASGLAVLLLPTTVLAATDSDTTTINAEIESVISISTSTTVTINVIPITGGAQSSASDTVTVSTNNATGYNLTLANTDADTDLEDGANAIAAHTGTHASPTALANNSWGYAVAGGNFDGSYSALSNAASSTSLWAGVPVAASPNTLKTTSTPSGSDVTTVWYSVKADTTKPSGTYTDIVTYTATTNN